MPITTNHPLIHSLVNTLRDNSITAFVFRHTIEEITKLLLYDALRDLPLIRKEVNTWKGIDAFDYIDEKNIMVVSVLRAALPMHNAVIDVLSGAVSGFLGIKRDEISHISTLYYDRVGDCSGKTVIIVDPMVATGGSLCDAIETVINKGAKEIITLNIIGSPEGVAEIEKRFPEIKIVIAKVDEKLDENKFIIPGLGDAGDRAYNTF